MKTVSQWLEGHQPFCIIAIVLLLSIQETIADLIAK